MALRKLGRSDVVPIIKRSLYDSFNDDVMGLAAGVAFYAALSLAPLLSLTLAVTSVLGPSVQVNLIAELTRLLGAQVGDAIAAVIANVVATPASGVGATVVSVVTVLVSSTGAFAQLQTSMNRIWDVEPRPDQGLTPLLRARLLSLGVVIAFGFLLLVSMAASAVLSAFVGVLGSNGAATLVWRVADVVLSLALFALMFGVMFRVLPDVSIRWRAVVAGSVVTSVLFVAGKLLIGLYIGQSTLASSYGAAGSLIAMLVWVYYSSVIVFLGAEFTKAWADRRGDAIEPSARARRVAHYPDASASSARGG